MHTTTTAPAGAQRVLIVDDQQTFAALLARVLDHEEGFTTVGTATTAADAMKLLRREEPDVVVLDVGLPDMLGTDLCKMMLEVSPDLRVVMLTADGRPDLAARASIAGAAGFLLKSCDLQRLLLAVRDARPQNFMMDPSALKVIAGSEGEPAIKLTAREQQILRLMSLGMDGRSIARELHLSQHTTRGYTKSLYRKLNVHSQLEAVNIGHRLGAVEFGT